VTHLSFLSYFRHSFLDNVSADELG